MMDWRDLFRHLESEVGYSPYECDYRYSSHEPVAHAAQITVQEQCPLCGDEQVPRRMRDECASIIGGLNEIWSCQKCGYVGIWYKFVKQARRDDE